MTPTARGLREISMRALAIGLAGVIWVVAGSEKSRIASTPTFDAVRDARVVVRNVPPGMVVTEAPSSVTVRLRGASGLEATAGAAEIIAVVDMAGVTPGQHLLTADPLPPSGLEVVRSGAITVGVTVEELVFAEFDVEAAISASMASEGMAQAGPSPSKVRVEGPRAAVDRVSHVVALALTCVEEALAETEAEAETQTEVDADAEPLGEDQGERRSGDGALDENGGPIESSTVERQRGAVATVLALDDDGNVVRGVDVYPGVVLVRWEAR
jgi:YbbR domain-containing protein